MVKKQEKYFKYKLLEMSSTCFLFFIICIISLADNNIPPLIKRPDEDNSKQKTITAEVVAVRMKDNVGNNNTNTENNKGVLEGDEALSFITQKLGVKDYELAYKDKQILSMEERKELNYRVSEKLNYCVVPKEVVPPGVFTLDTRVQIDDGSKKIDAIQAVAKAKIGEPLVYKGIQLEDSNYIIVLTLKSEDENQSQSGEQNQQEQNQEQEKEQKENEQNVDKQNNQQEQKDNEENKKENRQLQLLLESLEDMDQKEQKEMLNERERIMLPEKWW